MSAKTQTWTGSGNVRLYEIQLKTKTNFVVFRPVSSLFYIHTLYLNKCFISCTFQKRTHLWKSNFSRKVSTNVCFLEWLNGLFRNTNLKYANSLSYFLERNISRSNLIFFSSYSLSSLGQGGAFKIPRPTYVDPNLLDDYFF